MTFKHSLSNRAVLICALKRHSDFTLNLLDANMLVLRFLFSLAHAKMIRAAQLGVCVCEHSFSFCPYS